MKASIDRDGCISCGLCVSYCPEVFRFGEDGSAEVYVETVPSEFEEEVTEAVDSCPVSVISAE